MKIILLIMSLAALICLSPAAQAAGTVAGTIIINQATADFDMDGEEETAQSNVVSMLVAELLNVNVTWQDASNINVLGGSRNQVLTLRVTNSGNGREAFALEMETAVGGDQFDPIPVSMYLDKDDDGKFDADKDDLYSSGTNDPDLAPDGFATVFVLGDIPVDRVERDLGNALLRATSKTGTGAPGTVFTGMGDEGTDAVVGTTTASSSGIGTYQIRSVVVSIVKAAEVKDLDGGTKVVSGATVKYTLTVTAGGVGLAKDVVITDPIPTNSTYISGSLKLNGVSLTDDRDSDAGDMGGRTADTISVDLDEMSILTPAQIINFEVMINSVPDEVEEQ